MTYPLIKINLHGGSSAVIVWFLTSLSVLVSSEMKDEWFIVGNGSDAETISFSEFRNHRTQAITFQ